MEFKQDQNQDNEQENWREAIFLLESIVRKIENYKLNSEPFQAISE